MLPLKQKIVYEYLKVLKEYQYGKSANYNHILDMINLLDIHKKMDHMPFHFLEAKYLQM